MKKTVFIMIVIFALNWTLALGQNKVESDFKKLADQILDNLDSFFPVVSAQKGIHNYDYTFTNYSGGSIKGEIEKLKKYEKDLVKKFGKANLSPESRINYRLLKSGLDITLLNLNKIEWHKKNPYLYVSDAVNGIYLIVVSEYAPLETRAQNINARMKLIPDLFKQAKKNLKNPPPVYIQLAREMLTTGIDFFRTVEADLSAKLPDLAGELNVSTSGAIDAMRDFAEFLATLPPGDPGSFAIGKQNFDYKLQHEYLLDYDSDSLLKIGENLLEKYRNQYNDYLAELEAENPTVDSVFVIDCITRNDILRYYNWEVDQTKLFIEQNGLVTLPDNIGQCRVVETPPFLTNMISGIAYEPPGVFSPVQTGLFYVRPIPDSMDAGQREARYKFINRRGFKSSVVHEAYPGHHLQFQYASQIENRIRKWHENMCFIEGWALYCEEMMYDQGFYGSDNPRYLNILGGIIFRAARIVVDVKLQTGQMTIDEAVNWMAEQTGGDTSWIRIEINRYTTTPTIPMSYLIGKEEIVRLRDYLMETDGDNFSLGDFHDRLLSEGAIPPHLLWDIWGLKE
nr:DUF885 domain-containing protein [candidate division Zixibacteria bacterium]